MKQFMPELADPKDRLLQMQSEAAKVEKTTYQKQLTSDELAARREDLTDDCIKLEIMEDELKRFLQFKNEAVEGSKPSSPF